MTLKNYQPWMEWSGVMINPTSGLMALRFSRRRPLRVKLKKNNFVSPAVALRRGRGPSASELAVLFARGRKGKK